MTHTATTELALPAAMREAAEEVVVEAEDAAHDVIMALDQAVTNFEGQLAIIELDATSLGHAIIKYAEQNLTTVFAFTHKLLRAATIDEVVRLQTEFVRKQCEAMTEQTQQLGRIAVRGAIDFANS
jgi:hypothetical protein